MGYKYIALTIISFIALGGCATTSQNIGEAIQDEPLKTIDIVLVEPRKPIVREIYPNSSTSGGLLGGLAAISIMHSQSDDAQKDVNPFHKLLTQRNIYEDIFDAIKRNDLALDWAEIRQYHYLDYDDDFDFPAFVHKNISSDGLIVIEPQFMFPERYEVLEMTAVVSLFTNGKSVSRIYSNDLIYQSRIYDRYKYLRLSDEAGNRLSEIQAVQENKHSDEASTYVKTNKKIIESIEQLDVTARTTGTKNPNGHLWLQNKGEIVHTFIKKSTSELPRMIFTELNDRSNRQARVIVPIQVFSRAGNIWGATTASMEAGYELYNDGERHIVRLHTGYGKEKLWSKKIEYPLLSKRGRWYPLESLTDKDGPDSGSRR